MLNVIRMEIVRMFKTRSFYITIALGAIIEAFMLCLFSYTINQTQESEPFVACPNSVCSCIITMGIVFVAVFAACFVGNFYSDGFSKNVISKVRHRAYFQAAKAVCMMIYTTILLMVTSISTIIAATFIINDFEISHLGDFALFLLGEYCLLVAIGLAATFFTELSGSKMPAIIYVVLISTNVVSTIVYMIDSKLSDWFSSEIAIEDYIVSLYQMGFQSDIPSSVNIASGTLIHALVLSLAAFAIYNVLGAVVVSKRDIK